MTPDQELLARVGSAKNGADLTRALATYYKAAGAHSASLTEAAPKSPACAPGCALCCHLPVAARAQEVLLLADFIKRTFSASELTQLIGRLAHHAALTALMTSGQEQPSNIPCPLLREARCSAYEGRPFACRSYHSLDLSACQKTFDAPADLTTRTPQDPNLGRTWQRMTGLANSAFSHHGYDQNAYQLSSALLEALTNPATSRRFSQLKKAFPGAQQLKTPS